MSRADSSAMDLPEGVFVSWLSHQTALSACIIRIEVMAIYDDHIGIQRFKMIR
jgi:hypothetical protein